MYLLPMTRKYITFLQHVLCLLITLLISSYFLTFIHSDLLIYFLIPPSLFFLSARPAAFFNAGIYIITFSSQYHSSNSLNLLYAIAITVIYLHLFLCQFGLEYCGCCPIHSGSSSFLSGKHLGVVIFLIFFLFNF